MVETGNQRRAGGVLVGLGGSEEEEDKRGVRF